jgi:hypothetical protein
LTAVAASSAVSAPSTSVYAAQLITARRPGLRDDAIGVGDVQVDAGERDDVVPEPGDGGGDGLPEHPRPSGDQQAHEQIIFTKSALRGRPAAAAVEHRCRAR